MVNEICCVIKKIEYFIDILAQTEVIGNFSYYR